MADLFQFAPGATVYVLTDSGAEFVGHILGLRHQDDARPEVQFLFLRLTSASSPYSVGDVVAINVTLIISIGPLTTPA